MEDKVGLPNAEHRRIAMQNASDSGPALLAIEPENAKPCSETLTSNEQALPSWFKFDQGQNTPSQIVVVEIPRRDTPNGNQSASARTHPESKSYRLVEASEATYQSDS